MISAKTLCMRRTKPKQPPVQEVESAKRPIASLLGFGALSMDMDIFLQATLPKTIWRLAPTCSFLEACCKWRICSIS
jgi:hypothetical protein